MRSMLFLEILCHVDHSSLFSSVRMKVLAVDQSHVIFYQCLDYDTSQATCRADATHVYVLSHDSTEDLSSSVISWAANAVHQACIEFGDLDHTHHSSQSQLLSFFLSFFFSLFVCLFVCFFVCFFFL